ncbi:MAG: hypothetical protein ACT443_02180 [Gemmatimonadota bacterium]
MRFRFALILLAAVSVSACDDDFGVQPWDATPDTVPLFSLSRPDNLGLPSAYDFVNRRQVEVEQPGSGGNWDVALGEANGQLQLIPAAAFEGQGSSRARIAVISGQSFEALEEAPSDTIRYTAQPVNLTVGGVYVVRTRREACGFTRASYFAKIKAVSVDVADGRASFAVVVNPFCDRSFVPPAE